MRTALFGLIALLYLISIPWYRSSGGTTVIWLGLPDWVAVSVACYVAVAVLNAAAWLLTDIPDSEGEGEARSDPEDGDRSG